MDKARRAFKEAAAARYNNRQGDGDATHGSDGTGSRLSPDDNQGGAQCLISVNLEGVGRGDEVS